MADFTFGGMGIGLRSRAAGDTAFDALSVLAHATFGVVLKNTSSRDRSFGIGELDDIGLAVATSVEWLPLRARHLSVGIAGTASVMRLYDEGTLYEASVGILIQTVL